MILRSYQPADCAQLAALFYGTVHSVNARDYTPAELDAWTGSSVDLDAWNRSFLEHYTVVAEENGIIVGFGDMDATGYLDRLFVHKDAQGRGIGSAICDALERAVSSEMITTHASITAKPFFLRRGYLLVEEQQVRRGKERLTNFVMQKKNPAR
ncbi:GNAT family N-acetyltransferase [Zongyangia hominis]|uniref:GNAT family N-acetyltransferase n=1 Tax=Zongyangia hominis TaxID=2763677 RepID=A0A926EAN0_9FIRM|nr:GNAT family N-acetyltransferase [Zongyangia hominis]MBC8570283.1 GNAT family N-acetyltransferase [Zongyangia hominis]